MNECKRCGKCCLKYSNGSGLGCATKQDMSRWVDRPDILVYADPSLPDLWVSPKTGEETNRCPWLRKDRTKNTYTCRIHNVRPDVCRAYPINKGQMVNDGCEMLDEQKDRF